MARVSRGDPWAIALQQFNLLGTHDTPRVATLWRRRGRIRAAATLLMTFPGVPLNLLPATRSG